MKRTAGYLLIILLFLLVGCEKHMQVFIGKWTLIYSNATEYFYINKISDTTITYNPGESVIEFFEEWHGNHYYNGDVVGTFDWSVDEGLLFLTWDNGHKEILDYGFSADTLHIKSQNLSEVQGHFSYLEKTYIRF